MQHRALVRMLARDLLVQFHAEARCARRNDVALLPGDGLPEDLGVKALPALDAFEDEEIRTAGGELDVGGSDDRPAVEMRCDLHMFNFCHACDFLRLENAAD